MYIRSKNLGSQNSEGKVYLFWLTASLLMLPEQWKQNTMFSNVDGIMQPYNILPKVSENQISVTKVPFIWSPKSLSSNEHYCTVSAVSTTLHPWDPGRIPEFQSIESFVLWVRQSANICSRNITTIYNPLQPDVDRVDLFSNPFSDPVPLLVQVKCNNIPVGTSVTIICKPLGVDLTKVTTSKTEVIFSSGVTCPEYFNGYIETRVTRNREEKWPDDADITTTVYMGVSAQSKVAKYAQDFELYDNHPSVLQTKQLADKNNGALVAVGACTTNFKQDIV